MEVCGAWYALWPYMNAMPHPSPVMAVRRIFALSLQGDTLQVYTNPDKGQFFGALCYFDGKLLATCTAIRNYRCVSDGIMAMAGA